MCFVCVNVGMGLVPIRRCNNKSILLMHDTDSHKGCPYIDLCAKDRFYLDENLSIELRLETIFFDRRRQFLPKIRAWWSTRNNVGVSVIGVKLSAKRLV